ncbi:hypothetical protein EI42_03163 [Thermosporothrix hazakensis]|jgi:DNA repair exonuclease SbcCD ATPase subunit|uniref:Uncharacterized protein n=1 Tax=Thermosporothrix hazakensis TaxID=644383 RepID=A0A326UIZ2_THEHA|nr:hypothetical protein [Thermosporothrix hazakensis]PZW28409.1 hypothetical protein EI42_03163 [Thermosporothrix hazakensis]GCE45189.1 hypothetical protein KTH_00580 [Thermosporothrix hazakensis]
MPLDDYREIRQIMQDVVEPLKVQLEKIEQTLNREYVRKESNDHRLEALQKELDEAKARLEELEAQLMGAPQKLLLTVASLVGLALSLLNLSQYLK